MKDFHGLPMARMQKIVSAMRPSEARTMFQNAVDDLVAGNIMLNPLGAPNAADAAAVFFIIIGDMPDSLMGGTLYSHEGRDTFWYRAFQAAEAILPKPAGPPPLKRIAGSKIRTLAVLAVGRPIAGGPIVEFGHHPLLPFGAAAGLVRPQLENIRLHRREVN